MLAPFRACRLKAYLKVLGNSTITLRANRRFRKINYIGTVSSLSLQASSAADRNGMAPSLTDLNQLTNQMNDTMMRVAAPDDIPGIMELISQRPGYLKTRSVDDIAAMVYRQHGVVAIATKDIIREQESGQKPRTIACGEVVFFLEAVLVDVDKEGERAVFELCEREFKRPIPVQKSDIVIYLGCMVAARGYSDGIMQARTWLANRYGEAVFRARMERRRIIFLGGIFDCDKFFSLHCKFEALITALLDTYPLDPKQGGNNKESDDQTMRLDNNMHKILRPSYATQRKSYMCIVHLDPLPTALQQERLARNAVLITETEQRRLLQSRIGVVGLSTGSVVLEICLHEGLGGVYRIADFDIFEASNANRMLFSPVDDVGKTKTQLVVDHIRHFDPEIRVETFEQGLTEKNMRDFVRNCDLIVEECDNFSMKVLVRKVAREFSIPVLMGISVNGMIDVERHDLGDEWMSPLLNVAKPSTPDLTPNVLRSIYDTNHFSPRTDEMVGEMAAGNISSWSQLAEEVHLVGSCVAHAARRILLGDTTLASGRFSIKLDDLFRKENRITTKTNVQVHE